MRPCGVINTVGGTRITDRHLLPVDGPRPWPGCQAPGKISIVSFCVTQVSPLFLLFFFLFWVEEETARNREGEKERTWCTVAGSIQIRRAIFISYFSARLIAARVSPFDKCCAFLDALYN